MSAILAFIKLVYEHKEKVILGVMIVAFAGVAAYQWKAGKNGGSDGTSDGNSSGANGGEGAVSARKPKTYKVTGVANQYPLEKTLQFVKKRDVFAESGIEGAGSKQGGEQGGEWAEIKVKSIFDPTRSGSYIAIIEVDDRRRFVQEGERFGEYEIRRIDGVRKCLTIVRRGSGSGGDEKEFCKEE